MTELISPANVAIEARNRLSGFASAFFIVWALLFVQGANAQTFSVLHAFSGAADGANPYAGLTLDRGGNLYGTTYAGGTNCQPNGCGTVFKMSSRGSGWFFTALYSFQGMGLGTEPRAPVIFGPDGALYGTALGGSSGAGIVFRLTPRPYVCPVSSCPWIATILYQFNGTDGSWPSQDPVIFDSAGNLYGANETGGQGGCLDGTCGTVYELTKSGGVWTESRLYKFSGNDDGAYPNGVILDVAGNLFGTTLYLGPVGLGTAFKLTPENGGLWSETTLYSFGMDGGSPSAGPIFDSSGDLFGTSSYGGAQRGGTVWQLSPSGGSWLLNTLYSFYYPGNASPVGPYAKLTMDAEGNLYGTTYGDGAYGYGNVFKLTATNGAWTYSSLHDFTGGTDGGAPISQVTLDGVGNLYGTTTIGGTVTATCPDGCGVVWEITP